MNSVIPGLTRNPAKSNIGALCAPLDTGLRRYDVLLYECRINNTFSCLGGDSPSIGYQEREVFEAFLALPAPQRKVVREVIEAFAKAFPEKNLVEKSER